MRRIKIGVIGVGEIGKIHSNNIIQYVPELELIAITDRLPGLAKSYAKRLGISKAFENYQDLLQDKSIEAVLISTTPDSHAQIIKEAAAAGKHIFCEKPIGIDLNEVNNALKIVEEKGAKLQIGFNRRFDPHFQRLRAFIAEGKIGSAEFLHITSRDPEPPGLEYFKVSGGIFMDMTIHDFDIARYIIGGEVEEIYTAGSALIEPKIGELGDVDTVAFTLKFKNGVIGVIENSCRAVFGYDQRVEVLGSQGMACVLNPSSSNVVVANQQGFHAPPLFHFFTDRYRESYIFELKAFADSLLLDKETAVTGQDGLIAVKMAVAAKMSLESKIPVNPLRL